MECGQWCCIGGWVGVIDSLRVGCDHHHGFMRAVKKVILRCGIAFLIAALKELDVCAVDIGNAYLNADCKERIWV